MKTRQSAALERKKFFGDPVMVATIFSLIILLALFILYPLAMLLTDSVHVRETQLYTLESVLSGEADVPYLDGGKSLKVVGPKNVETVIPLEDLSASYGYLYVKNGRVIRDGDKINPATAHVKINSSYWTADAFPRIFQDYTFKKAFTNTLTLGFITSFGAVVIGLLFAYVDCYVKVSSPLVKKMFGRASCRERV